MSFFVSLYRVKRLSYKKGLINYYLIERGGLRKLKLSTYENLNEVANITSIIESKKTVNQ